MKQETNPVKAIRAFCLGCCGDSPSAVRECAAPDCALYAFRLGHNPYRKSKDYTEEELEEMRARLRRNKERTDNA